MSKILNPKIIHQTGNCNSLHIITYDEAITTPTEESGRQTMVASTNDSKMYHTRRYVVPNFLVTSYEPTLIFPYAIYFAEAMNIRIYALPFNQFLLEKTQNAGFEFIDFTN